MEVEEPAKSIFDYVQEWIDYYTGKRESPHLVTLLVEEEKKSKKRPVEEDIYLFRVPEETPARQQKRQRFRGINYFPPNPKALDYIGNDTKLERQFRFKGIVLDPDDRTVRGRLIKEQDEFTEDPYDDQFRTWRTRTLMARLNIPSLWYIPPSRADTAEIAFDELYNRTDYMTMKVESYSRPDIHLLEVLPSNREKFKEILYGDSQLLMKLTPFIDDQGRLIDELSIQQIYDEIKIAYFLNELIYGYTHVLSVHFMVMVDWFQSSRAKLGLFANPLVPTTLDNFQSQITISEYAESNINDYMLHKPSFGKLRAVIFQVMHALETAWHTNEFVHYDLHTGNILFKRTDHEESPFRGRNFLYKRRNHHHWFVLKKEDLDDHLVKIIDFGFSRIQAPSTPFHELISVSPSHPPHLHERVIGLDWPENAMNPEAPNRYTDVRMFFLSLLILPAAVWQAMTVEERQSFYDLVERVLDFDEINRILNQFPFNTELGQLRLRTIGNVRITAANLGSCVDCVQYLVKFGGYIRGTFRGFTQYNMTATDVLNHPFFDPLKREPINRPSNDWKSRADSEDIVVSFLDEETYAETQMLKRKPNLLTLKSNGKYGLKCAVCHSGAKSFNLEGKTEVPLCGTLCAEFKYLYKCKTVFR